jgi:hypothetical protein
VEWGCSLHGRAGRGCFLPCLWRWLCMCVCVCVCVPGPNFSPVTCSVFGLSSVFAYYSLVLFDFPVCLGVCGLEFSASEHRTADCSSTWPEQGLRKYLHMPAEVGPLSWAVEGSLEREKEPCVYKGTRYACSGVSCTRGLVYPRNTRVGQ